MNTYGIYLHIPFCKSKCLYCDFCSFPHTDSETIERYVDALCREIKQFPVQNQTVDSIYFGGGTPSLLTEAQLEKILNTIFSCYSVTNDCEITLECNPGTVNKAYLSSARNLSVNRLSIGIQSSSDAELKKLGRLHSFKDAKQCVTEAEAVGFFNISVDLMYGIPTQTKETFLQSVRDILALSPTHISAYSLIVEEGTPFYRFRDKISFPDDDTVTDFYETLNQILRDYGYLHYEISNYAKKGFESRHNMKYWKTENYLGFGIASYGCYDGFRYGHSRDLTAYLKGDGTIVDRETLSETQKKVEYIMLHLRLKQGISLQEYKTVFQSDFILEFGATLKKYEQFFHLSETHIALTESGMYVSNRILSELLSQYL